MTSSKNDGMAEIRTGDIMLDAVINMPYEMAMATELSRSQFYSRAHQALETLAACRGAMKSAHAEREYLTKELDPEALMRELDHVTLCHHEIYKPTYLKELLIQAFNALRSAAAEREASEKNATIGAAIGRAAAELPDGYEIEITVERGAGSVYLHNPDGMSIGMDVDADNRIAAEINAAVDDAVESANAIHDAIDSGRECHVTLVERLDHLADVHSDNHPMTAGMVREAAARIRTLEEAVRCAKALVVGDKSPNWHDDSMTYITRGKIADICDIALKESK